MFAVLFIFIFLTCLNRTYSEESIPVAHTRSGVVRGFHKESFSGRKYEAYEGIPYALPPTKHRRFQPPEPTSEWKGTLLATKLASPCIQYTQFPSRPNDRVEGDEDCLYLNVYVPSTARAAEPLPVLFSIHGGAFQYDSAYTGVKFLMDRDVIVVSFNYRLGIFGFLSTEDENVPGNMGLKDQSLALRWVSENIEYFGGDGNRITLIGISAGAASVHYHYLSPMSRGLFSNGISFSSTTFGPGKQTENSREKFFKLANVLGCASGSDTRKLVECVQYRPARSVAQATSHFMPWLYNPFTPFGPVVEKKGKNSFVNRSPIEIIEDGDFYDALWITGVVSEEGLYPSAEFINDGELLKQLDENWESIAPHLLDYNFTIPVQKHVEVSRKIREFYLGTRPINRDSVNDLVRMIGDRLYHVDGEKGAWWHAKMSKSPVLFYLYSYRASKSFSDYMSNSTNNYGVSHTDDWHMVFDTEFIHPPDNTTDRAMQIKMLDFIVSVATKGYPDMGLDFEWRSVNASKEFEYLQIAGPDDIKMSSDGNFGQKHFWSTIGFDENRLSMDSFQRESFF